MKIGTNRIILSCVFSCLAFVLTTNGDAQLRSIVFAQSEGAGVAQLSQEELSPRLNDQRVMHVNQPSDDSSVFATSHLSEPEQLPPTPSVSIVQLDEVQYGSPIAPGVTVFEVKNFGTEDVRDVNIEIAVENSARMLSIEPATTIIAAKAARVELNSIPAGQSKLVKIHSASGNGNPVEYTTRVLVEAAEQLGTNDAQSVALPVNPIPRNPIPLNPVPRKADQDSSVMHQGPPVDLATAGPNELLNEIASDSIRETPAPPEDPVIIEVETPNQFILGVP